MDIGLNEQALGERFRVQLLMLGVAVVVLVLFVALWRTQVVGAEGYTTSLNRQSIRRVRLPATRGMILDRYGECLARNRPCYSIVVYVEELRQPGNWRNTHREVMRTLAAVTRLIGQEPSVGDAEVRRHVSRRIPLPLVAWKDVQTNMLARFSEHADGLGGVDIFAEPVRCYPQGTLASHLIGYVGKSSGAEESAETDDETYHFYLPDVRGRNGIERAFDSVLSGIAGGELIQVDATGFKREGVSRREPVSGQDLRLTMDVRVQRLAERAVMGDRGAVVVMDPRSGDVIAMASSPTFDPNRFTPVIAENEWKALLADEAHPLLNRAVAGLYAPGSTFKPVVALAALAEDMDVCNTIYDCPGYFEVGGKRFACWQTVGHGPVGINKAIEQSCNVFFCQLGLRIGADSIYAMAASLGFGRKTGIELGGELAGLLPDDRWKRARMREGWRGGDTCNLAIGQGFLGVTPIQMAVYVSAIANGGRLLKPRLVQSEPMAGMVQSRVQWPAGVLDVVRRGMHDVIESPDGSGKRARVAGVEMAGKTGTAEYEVRSERRKYAWMILYAPYDEPRYAVVMVLENEVSGGVSVAPRLHEIMEGVFLMETAPFVRGRT